jgi:hypothetical protein
MILLGKLQQKEPTSEMKWALLIDSKLEILGKKGY